MLWAVTTIIYCSVFDKHLSVFIAMIGWQITGKGLI